MGEGVEPDEEIECESRLNPGGNICTCYWEVIYSWPTAGVLRPPAELRVWPLEALQLPGLKSKAHQTTWGAF